jgi:hypothetical protein
VKTFETADPLETGYELPDGQVITNRDQLFRCCEMLFNPSIMVRERRERRGEGRERQADRKIEKRGRKER